MAKRVAKIEIGDTIEVAGAAKFVCTGLTLMYGEPAYVEFKTPDELVEVEEETN